MSVEVVMVWRWGYELRPKFITRYLELRDLIISWAVLTFAFAADDILRGELIGLVASAVAVATAFILHELAHREVARRYGLIARYRAWYLGLLLALVIALITAKATGTSFVIAAPGAVYIFTRYYQPYIPYDIEGRIALAGPASNLAVGFIMLSIKHFIANPLTYYVLDYVGSVNMWLAIFNLIPIPPLDGYKVLRYSVTTWAALIVLSIIAYFTL